MQQKYYKQKQTANADSVNNFMRVWSTSYQHAQNLQKNNTKRDMIRVCTELHFNLCKEIGVKLNNKNYYDHVPKSVKTSHESKVTILRNQQV
jgi:hypothetical protein